MIVELPMIIPGILEKEFSEVLEKIKELHGAADLIQIDIADGKFVENKTFQSIEKLGDIDTDINFEIHLMVSDPKKYLKEKIKNVTRVVAHVEVDDVYGFIDKAKDLGYKVGLSLNPGTPLKDLAPYMDKIDYAQFMTVEPGKQGQEFETQVLDKLTIFRQTAPRTETQVDGGIDEHTLTKAMEAGAQNVIVGSQIFQSPEQSFEHFEEKAKGTKEHGHAAHRKIKKIGFFGGASWEKTDQTYKDAYETARLLAEMGYEIVNGGGPGVMRAATQGAKKSGGKTLAVTYYPAYKHKNYEGTDTENKFDEEIITTDYFDRTKVMLQNSDVHVVFKGGTGTISEFGMTWASSRIHEGHHKPIILFGRFWEHIIEEFDIHMMMRPGEKELLQVADTPEEVVKIIKSLKRSSGH